MAPKLTPGEHRMIYNSFQIYVPRFGRIVDDYVNMTS